MARFKELCMDTERERGNALATFWAAAVGALVVQNNPHDPGDVMGVEEYQGIAICPVPEAKTVKHRVHLDVYAASIDELVARGASVVLPAEESGFGWTVMRDPEGNEFCAFVRDQVPMYRLHGIAVDSADPEAQARWWAEALGAAVNDNAEHGGGWWTLEGATPDPVLTMDFAPVPEPKTVKNRIHWDVYGTVEEFEARGATRLWDTKGWVVLADPEGNEFCVFPDKMLE
ncbi:MAG: VOC family protein [Marmoricola sp.]